MTELVYAVGDVHGRLDLMNQMLDQIRSDVAAIGADRPNVVFLGDLIDRGPHSAGCLDRIIALQAESWCSAVSLLGNHEQAMLRFLADASQGAAWTQHGGGATLKSYGVAAPQADASLDRWEQARLELIAATPRAHVDLIEAMPLWAQSGDYLFVHAGVRPGVPLEKQTRQDILWIRGDFLTSKQPHEKVVVHGHTPTAEPEMKDWRIGIDTGAYASGVLTAVRLEGDVRRIMQTRLVEVRA